MFKTGTPLQPLVWKRNQQHRPLLNSQPGYLRSRKYKRPRIQASSLALRILVILVVLLGLYEVLLASDVSLAKAIQNGVAGKAGGDCQQLLWFTTIDDEADTQPYQSLLKAALLSAREHAPSLTPVVMYLGPKDDAVARGVEALGAKVCYLKSWLQAACIRQFKHGLKSPAVHIRYEMAQCITQIRSGAIPIDKLQQTDTNHVLYTDLDVQFFQDINSCSLPKTPTFSIGPEARRINNKPHIDRGWNNGVMYANISFITSEFLPWYLEYQLETKCELISSQVPLIQWSRLKYLEAYPEEANRHQQEQQQQELDDAEREKKIKEDQERELNGAEDYDTEHIFTLLPSTYNWKGYWGSRDDVKIFHWHGPKPYDVQVIAYLYCYDTPDEILYRFQFSAYYKLVQWAFKNDGGAMYRLAVSNMLRYYHNPLWPEAVANNTAARPRIKWAYEKEAFSCSSINPTFEVVESPFSPYRVAMVQWEAGDEENKRIMEFSSEKQEFYEVDQFTFWKTLQGAFEQQELKANGQPLAAGEVREIFDVAGISRSRISAFIQNNSEVGEEKSAGGAADFNRT